jgi:hypothetical protein
MDYNDILEAIDQLPLEAQIELVETVRRRVRERRHDELAREVQQTRKEFESNLCPVITPEDGLISLAGGWEGSEELTERVAEIRRKGRART